MKIPFLFNPCPGGYFKRHFLAEAYETWLEDNIDSSRNFKES